MSNLLVKKNESKKIDENGVSVFHEYNLPFDRMSVGVSEIHGRYPKVGFDADKKVEAVWYVIEGKASIYLKGEIYEVESGDMIMIPANEKFWIDADHLKLVVVSSPPWTFEQHTHVEE